MTPEYVPFPKVPRLSREMIITEKLDGTNAQVNIQVIPFAEGDVLDVLTLQQRDQTALAVQMDPIARTAMVLRAGSRNKWIWPGSDNAGFAGWVQANRDELFKLGEGAHFGEWWGQSIQRTYGLTEKRFSLFNVSRWTDDVRPACCHVVPTLYRGEFDTENIDRELFVLGRGGSKAAPGFMRPEGIIIYHVAAGMGFKKTLDRDEEPKGLAR